MKIIHWFRYDLRITDNPALFAACEKGEVLPIYIFSPEEQKSMGALSKVWLHHSLKSLNESLGNKLNIYSGEYNNVLFSLIQKKNIDAIYWNNCYQPFLMKSDNQLKEEFKKKQINYNSFHDYLLWRPWQVQKKDKTPYKVFSHFYYRGCLELEQPRQPIQEKCQLNLLQDEESKKIII